MGGEDNSATPTDTSVVGRALVVIERDTTAIVASYMDRIPVL